MQTLAVERTIKTLHQLQSEFNLQRVEVEDFFVEWVTDLPTLNPDAQNRLDQIRERFLYQFSEGRLGEETIKLIVLSPLLELAGLYNRPFQFRAEETIYLEVPIAERRYRGRIDALVLQEQFWVVAIESKETSFSLGLAMPQLLAYLLASPNRDRPVYGMVTNGELFSFAKVQTGQTSTMPQYDISSTFSLLARGNELYNVLQILQRMGQIVLQGRVTTNN